MAPGDPYMKRTRLFMARYLQGDDDMLNFEQLLQDLQNKAAQVANDVDVDAQVETARDAVQKVKERLEADPNARNAALGGGALLMLLMASKGGRRALGTVAKTGAVAAMGALAYKAWQERNGEAVGDVAPEDAAAAGFVTSDAADPEFSRGMIEAMAVAAHADGVIDAAELELIDTALKDAGLDISDLQVGGVSGAVLERIARSAKTPNHGCPDLCRRQPGHGGSKAQMKPRFSHLWPRDWASHRGMLH